MKVRVELPSTPLETIVLYRPVGVAELRWNEASGFRQFRAAIDGARDSGTERIVR
jgi:hypothetical protein